MNTNYVSIFPRVQAAFIDSLVIVGLMYASSEILALFESVPNFVRIILAVFIFLLYEPLFVSLFGQTIGHSKIKIIVRKDSNRKKYISFPQALIRFIVKFFLGWLSLLAISASEKKQAIHDNLVGSVVLEEEE